MKSILIIGGSGLVGSKLIEYAIPNYEIHATFNKNNIDLSGICSHKVDLLADRSRVISLIKSVNPDVVINTAALSSVDLCEIDQNLANTLHIDVTRDIATVCTDINSKLIHFSTDAVFDGKSDIKYMETDIPNPVNHYGKTRLIAEDIITKSSDLNVILRTAVVYGWHTGSRFTNWIIHALSEKRMVDPFSDQYNTPTLVDDLVNSILKIVEMRISGLYHAVGKTCISRYDFALLLADKFGLDKNLIKPVTSFDKRQDAPRPPKTCLDAQKLERLIGYTFCDIESGISFIHDRSKLV